MGLEADWLMMGSTTIRLARASGFDGYGQPTYATEQTLPAIVQVNRRAITGNDGRVEQTVADVFILSTSVRVHPEDRLYVTDSTTPNRLLAIDHVDDEQGQHHVEVTLG